MSITVTPVKDRSQPEQWTREDLVTVLDHCMSTTDEPFLKAGLRIVFELIRDVGDINVVMVGLNLLEDDLWPYEQHEGDGAA